MALDGKSISPMDHVALGTKMPLCRLIPYRLNIGKRLAGGYFYNITHALLLFTHCAGNRLTKIMMHFDPWLSLSYLTYISIENYARINCTCAVLLENCVA